MSQQADGADKDQARGLVPSFDDREALLIVCMDSGVRDVVSKKWDSGSR